MNILFIYSHLDDETILSYGTIAKLRLTGNQVHVCCLCGKGRKTSDNTDRRKAFLTNMHDLDIIPTLFEHNDLTLSENIIDKHIDHLFTTYPDVNVIYTHSLCDQHFEHQLVAERLLLKCRKTAASNVKEFYTSVLPNSLWTYDQFGKFTPNYFIDISRVIEQKKNALKRYKCELQTDSNDLRSIEAIIDQNRIYGRQMNTDYCEAYQQIFRFV